MRGKLMSSANRVSPTHFERASTLRKGLPITFSLAPSVSFPFVFIEFYS
jgi:hypothetical protein